jgi:branched-chain amino acid transport system substrate-binding protein
VLIAAIGEAAKFGKAATTRADVIATLRGLTFEGIAYAKPVQWAEKGDNKSAVIFVNVVEGHRFKPIDQISD